MKKILLSTSLLFYSLSGFSFRPIPEDENTQQLTEKREITSLKLAQLLKLEKGQTEIDLWSGSYWPHFQGSLSIRYQDPIFQNLIEKKEQWGELKKTYEKYPVYLYLSRKDLLSPAEKYDLIVGDRDMGLTKYAQEIAEKSSVLGKVPLWRGICDGWASASQMMPRPVKTVTMKTPEGESIKFFPEDIKALGSLLYARAQENVTFLGKRCRSRALGLFTDACNETNPGAFHLALMNRIGMMKKTFIADVSPGSEVWNYPVSNYSFTFFNVFNEETSNDFTAVMESFVKTWRFNRSFKRHKNTKYIVGVKAKVIYQDMRPAHLNTWDGPEFDKKLEKEYVYDLELDERFNILGGESLSANLPDFIWAPTDKTYPLSTPEKNQLPQNPSEIAAMAKDASKLGQPLSTIVEKLFESARP